jgi:hypothetical protein
VFVSEREAPMTDANFRKMLARAGRAAGFDFLVHPQASITGSATLCPLSLAHDAAG